MSNCSYYVLIEEEKYGYIPYIPISWQKDRIIKRIKVAKVSIDMRQIEVTNGVYRAENHALSKDSTTPLIPQ